MRRLPLHLGLFLCAATAAFLACSSFKGEDATADAGDLADAGASEGAAGDASAPGNGNTDVSPLGCADGTREGFLDVKTFPFLAACEGAFVVPGLGWTQERTCDAGGGNSGPYPEGKPCSGIDLCARGWRICRNGDDFQTAGGTVENCSSELQQVADSADAAALTFFATAQPYGAVAATCSPTATDPDGGANDVFGCAPTGFVSANGSCKPLVPTLGNNCAGHSLWVCSGSFNERYTVHKLSGPGGVLCCKE